MIIITEIIATGVANILLEQILVLAKLAIRVRVGVGIGSDSTGS